jgi:hypothetical protein
MLACVAEAWFDGVDDTEGRREATPALEAT